MFIDDAWKEYVHHPLQDQWKQFTGQKDASEQFERNLQMQKEFAQQGVRWKVEDAKKAGIHPLAALGASTTGYQPVVTAKAPQTGLQGIQSLMSIIGMFATLKNMFNSENSNNNLIQGQGDAPVGTVQNPGFESQDVQVSKAQKPGITAGNVPALSYMELPGKKLSLIGGQNPVGIEEDVWQFAGKQWSIAKIWARSKYYGMMDPATRNRHGFTQFIRLLAQIYPSHNNYPGEKWVWSLSQAKWISKKNVKSIWTE